MSSGMYTRTEFEQQRQLSAASARVIVPLVLDLLKPRSVVDVGCGVGTWMRVFADLGVSDYVGVDGHHVDADLLQIPPAHFSPQDLREGVRLDRHFDLACSLEVAEHLPSERAATFVDDLTRLGRAVLFSAAVPGQSGPGHINEQPQSYWAALFEQRGYMPLDVVRPAVWDHADVVSWYRQNILLYIRTEHLPSGYVRPALLDVIHPIAVEKLRHQLEERRVVTGSEGLAAVFAAVRRRLSGR